MSAVQQFFIKVMPQKWAEQMEAESRSWMFRCSECGHEQSVWDVGGIRWKARGNPSRLMRCSSCGKRAVHKLYQKL